MESAQVVIKLLGDQILFNPGAAATFGGSDGLLLPIKLLGMLKPNSPSCRRSACSGIVLGCGRWCRCWVAIDANGYRLHRINRRNDEIGLPSERSHVKAAQRAALAEAALSFYYCLWYAIRDRCCEFRTRDDSATFFAVAKPSADLASC